MDKKHMKSCSTLLAIKELQIKTAMRYHFTPTKVVIILKKENKCWQVHGKIGTLTRCWWECKMMQLLWKTVWQFLKELNIELLCDPTSLLLDMYPRELKNICPHKNLYTNKSS